MKLVDLLKFSSRALRERKLRAALTIIGIVIGPATIVSLVSATQGYSNAATSRFQDLGATTLFLTSVGRSFTFDAQTVSEAEGLAGVAFVVPYNELSGTVTQGGETVSVSVLSLNLTQLSHIFPALDLQQGSLPAASDTIGAAIGNSVAYPDISGASNLTLNEVLTVSNVRTMSFAFFGAGLGAAGSSSTGSTDRSFVITGIYGSFGQGFGFNPDDSVFISSAAGEQITHSTSYTGMVVIATTASAVSTVETELTDTYGQNVRVTSVTSLLSTIQSITQGSTTLLEAVGGTSILVAFIGIMTTMLTSVLERTTEIGVLKALGATSRSILAMFIAEASVTGLVGGIIGATAGAILSFFVISALRGSVGIPGGAAGGTTRLAGAGGAGFSAFGGPGASSASSTTLNITPAITPELIVVAILIATAVGTLGGLLPAWRASRLTPTEALHKS
ncbi:MAG TPA: ABC transporter permease [Nitrososphaerales archaeon]|nr:ABC transporter permease [Nitrososphaerales archaeon]